MNLSLARTKEVKEEAGADLIELSAVRSRISTSICSKQDKEKKQLQEIRFSEWSTKSEAGKGEAVPLEPHWNSNVVL